MRLLLDSHILIAIAERKTEALPAQIRALLEQHGVEFIVSVASLWEIAIKFRLGKLPMTVPPEDLPELITGLGFELLPIFVPHAIAAVEPEPPTRDPFDRLLLAQCKIEGLRLATIDRALIDHPLALERGAGD